MSEVNTIKIDDDGMTGRMDRLPRSDHVTSLRAAAQLCAADLVDTIIGGAR